MPIPVNRAASGLSFLLGFAGFLFAILSLFAGSTPSFLPAGDMMSVNISQIGKTPLFGGADLSKCKREIDERDFFSDVGNGVKNGIQQAGDLVNCGVEETKNGINQVKNDIVDKLTAAANLPGFIDLHVMNFCTGQFNPKDYVEKGIKDPKKDITFCSPKATSFSFSLTDIVQKNLPAGLTLQDIHWPAAIPEAEATLRTATRAMIYMYAVGTATAALTAIVSLVGVVISKGVVGLVSTAFAGISFFTLLIASAAGTAIIKKAVPKINQLGGPIGIAATQGNVYLGMTWAAVFVMFVAIVAGVGQFFARKRMSGNEYYDDKYDYYPEHQ